MNPLNEYLNDAKIGHYAIGHFNFATADVLKAIVQGAKEAGAPAVMVGTSEGEADFLGMKEAVALVRAIKEDLNFPVFLNADHFKSFSKCKEAIDAGYDSILMDGSKVSFQENASMTKQVVDYARGVNSNISVEGELGYLKGSSEVQAQVEISPEDYTKPEEVKEFVSQTGIDRLAVVFGNIHGIVKKVVYTTPTPPGVGVPTGTSGKEHLDIEHFKKIAQAADSLFVLHGASGLLDDEVSQSIKAGVVNVHFNTELRVAYTRKIEEVLQNKPDETTPYKYLAPAAQEVQKLVADKTKLFMR